MSSTAAADLRAGLLADAGVAALVGARVRFDMAGEADPYPFVVLRQLVNEPVRGLDDSLLARREVFQIEAWDETRHAAAQVHNAVEAALLAMHLPPEAADPDGLDPEVGARACVWNVTIWSNT